MDTGRCVTGGRVPSNNGLFEFQYVLATSRLLHQIPLFLDVRFSIMTLFTRLARFSGFVSTNCNSAIGAAARSSDTLGSAIGHWDVETREHNDNKQRCWTSDAAERVPIVHHLLCCTTLNGKLAHFQHQHHHTRYQQVTAYQPVP